MKRLFRCAIALLGFGCALILSTPAEANGRYPQAMQLVEDMRDDQQLQMIVKDIRERIVKPDA